MGFTPDNWSGSYRRLASMRDDNNRPRTDLLSAGFLTHSLRPVKCLPDDAKKGEPRVYRNFLKDFDKIVRLWYFESQNS